MTNTMIITENTPTLIERVIGGANIGSGEMGHFALVALVQNPDAAHAWLTQLSVAFTEAHEDGLFAAAEAKALVDARERSLIRREQEVAAREIKVAGVAAGLQKQSDALRVALSQ